MKFEDTENPDQLILFPFVLYTDLSKSRIDKKIKIVAICWLLPNLISSDQLIFAKRHMVLGSSRCFINPFA